MPCSISTVGPPPSVVKAGTEVMEEVSRVDDGAVVRDGWCRRSGRSKWPSVPPRDLVRARAVEEVAGKGAQLGAVEVALVVQRHAVPAGAG